MTEKLAVLFLMDDFAGPAGGTEQHMLFLQRALPRDAFDLHFALVTRFRGMRADDFPVRPVVLSEGGPRGPRGTMYRFRRLVSLIRSVRADVIHAFCRRSELLAILASRWAGRGAVLGVRRNIGYWHTWHSLWRARMVAALSAQYVANCDAARQFATKMEWIPPQRICVIRNPAPTGRLETGLANTAPRSALGIVNGENVVGMVANVRPIKDHTTFLHSARLVLGSHPRTRFVVVGGGEDAYVSQMKTLARELGIESRVSWLGPLPNPLAVVPRFDVAVLSSRSEALSNALLEYAAAGIATVATDVGGTAEVVQEGSTGFLVPQQSPELMAQRIGLLLSDADLRARFGHEARIRAQTAFHEAVVLDQYAQCYHHVAHRTGKPLAAAIQ